MKSVILAFLIACALVSACAPAPSEPPVHIDDLERSALGEFLYSTGIGVDDLVHTGLQRLGSHPQAVAVVDGHVDGLRLSDVKWPNLAVLPRFPSLKTLWLSSVGLTDTNGISGLPSLEELILDDNDLVALDLRDLPALRSVSVRHNRLPMIPDLGPNVTVNIEGNPAEEILKHPPPAPDSEPRGFVEWLPRRGGQLDGPSVPRAGGSLENRSFNIYGKYESLTGTAGLALVKIVDADPTVRAEVTVQTGRVWIYLQSPDGYGYVWAQASPGSPARITGHMTRGNRLFGVVLQSQDGTATGITYSVRQV